MAISEGNIRFIFGLKLRQLRADKEFSLAQLSDKTGISISYLNEIEKGKKYPKADKIVALSKALEVDYDDLVGLQLNRNLTVVSELIRSNFLEELPLDFFGIGANDLLRLLSVAPTKFSAFVNSVIQIGRTYDIKVEHFYQTVLRSYQEMHDNHFEKIESQATDFSREFGIDPHAGDFTEQLQAILESNYNYDLDFETLINNDDLKTLRYIFIPGKRPKLLLNSGIAKSQMNFILGKELGFNYMTLQERANTAPWLGTKSFEQVLNNFRSYYFSSALILEQKKFVKDLEAFMQNDRFEANRVLALLKKYGAGPEMFMLRISSMIPHFFRFNQMFFIRYNHDLKDDHFLLTKELHGSGIHKYPGSNLRESSCSRYAAITTLRDLAQKQDTQKSEWPLCRAFRLKYQHSMREYLFITIADSMTPTPGMNMCVAVGFEINNRLKQNVNFLGDQQIPKQVISFEWVLETGAYCEDLIEKPHALLRKQQINRMQKAVEELKNH